MTKILDQQKIIENGVKICKRYVFCESHRLNWNVETSLMTAHIFIQRRLRRPILIILLSGIRNNSFEILLQQLFISILLEKNA